MRNFQQRKNSANAQHRTETHVNTDRDWQLVNVRARRKARPCSSGSLNGHRLWKRIEDLVRHAQSQLCHRHLRCNRCARPGHAEIVMRDAGAAGSSRASHASESGRDARYASRGSGQIESSANEERSCAASDAPHWHQRQSLNNQSDQEHELSSYADDRKQTL